MVAANEKLQSHKAEFEDLRLVETFELNDYKTADDDQLIELTLRGSHRAFESLFARHKKQLYHSMLRVTKSADLSEELVQDSFVQAFVKLGSFKREAAFSSWIFRIALNKYLGMQRTRRASQSLDALEDNSHFEPIDPQDSPEQSCARSEDRDRVRNALDRLNPEVRRILWLREMKGLTYDEIGEELRLKPGTVRSQLSRARWKLHRELLQTC